MIDILKEEYYDWLCSQLIIEDNEYGIDLNQYESLLSYLYDTEFYAIHPGDLDRVASGSSLRGRFYVNTRIEESVDILNKVLPPCTMLELMVRLSMILEEDYLETPQSGNRTGLWFYNMLESLGLDICTDQDFDERYVRDVIWTFLNREYDSNGNGGLFYVDYPNRNMREEPIWVQMQEWITR